MYLFSHSVLCITGSYYQLNTAGLVCFFSFTVKEQFLTWKYVGVAAIIPIHKLLAKNIASYKLKCYFLFYEETILSPRFVLSHETCFIVFINLVET